jgi:hypothetical protein
MNVDRPIRRHLCELRRSLAWNAPENPEEIQPQGKGERIMGKGQSENPMGAYKHVPLYP